MTLKTTKKAKRPQGAPLAQQAYETVREAIENGQFAAGERVSEYRIADWLKISRTPAREALQRLEAEGLLAYQARRGLIVVSLDSESITELFEAREIVESSLAAKAAVSGSGPELNRIIEHTSREPSLVDDRRLMYQHNKEFHGLISAAAHNRYLTRFAQLLQDALAADVRGSSLVSQERRTQVIAEHRRLAEAIAARDADGAAKAARDHVKAAYAARMHVGSEQKPAPKASRA